MKLFKSDFWVNVQLRSWRIDTGYYMAARRYEISLRVLKNISLGSAAKNASKGTIFICSHNNSDLFTCEDNMLFSRVKICFRAKAHLVFHWCLYNKGDYFVINR